MDASELSKRYMEKYNELIAKVEKSDINKVVLSLNEAIEKSDVGEISILYQQILDWNSFVEKLEGARIAIDAQYHYLHLPSPSIYLIKFDWDNRLWEFNTEKKF